MHVNEERITFNVSGQIFETRLKTLENYPDTLLGNSSIRKDFYCKQSHQYFLNRNRCSFEAVLFFHQSKGRLYRPMDVPLRHFVQECNFYKIPGDAIHHLKVRERGYLQDKIRAKHYPEKVENLSVRMKIWNILENPGCNVYATCFFVVQIFAIFLSVTISCLESFHHGPEIDEQRLTLEIILSVWFFFEFCLRVVVTPSKARYFCSILNWIDLLAVAPHSLIYACTQHRGIGFFREIRFVRVLRILRLRKISARTKAVCIIFKDSTSDLSLFLIGLLITVTTGGAIMYYLEMGVENSHFHSIPEGMWWAVQTFLTVGYGDIYPKGISGRIFASFFMVLGMDTVLLPVLSLIMKFAAFVSPSYLS